MIKLCALEWGDGVLFCSYGDMSRLSIHESRVLLFLFLEKQRNRENLCLDKNLTHKIVCPHNYYSITKLQFFQFIFLLKIWCDDDNNFNCIIKWFNTNLRKKRTQNMANTVTVNEIRKILDLLLIDDLSSKIKMIQK